MTEAWPMISKSSFSRSSSTRIGSRRTRGHLSYPTRQPEETRTAKIVVTLRPRGSVCIRIMREPLPFVRIILFDLNLASAPAANLTYKAITCSGVSPSQTPGFISDICCFSIILTFNCEGVDPVKKGQAVWLQRIRAEVQTCILRSFSDVNHKLPLQLTTNLWLFPSIPRSERDLTYF